MPAGGGDHRRVKRAAGWGACRRRPRRPRAVPLRRDRRNRQARLPPDAQRQGERRHARRADASPPRGRLEHAPGCRAGAPGCQGSSRVGPGSSTPPRRSRGPRARSSGSLSSRATPPPGEVERGELASFRLAGRPPIERHLYVARLARRQPQPERARPRHDAHTLLFPRAPTSPLRASCSPVPLSQTSKSVARLDRQAKRSVRRTARKPLVKRLPGEAEGEGFEPSIRLTTDNGFRDRRIRPLCHPSTRRSGEGGIRTLEGGNYPLNALAGRRLQPLGHFSVRGHGNNRSGRLQGLV
jgi:hypothetical protein